MDTLRDMFDRANREWDEGNIATAFQLFNEAARKGSAYAQNTLGYFFDIGIGTTQDKVAAMEWYRKAAQNGDISAYANIATIYRDSNKFRQAKAWFVKAVDAGDGDAGLELGKLLLTRKSEKTRREASKYLRLAVDSINITEASRVEAQQLLDQIKVSDAKARDQQS